MRESAELVGAALIRAFGQVASLGNPFGVLGQALHRTQRAPRYRCPYRRRPGERGQCGDQEVQANPRKRAVDFGQWPRDLDRARLVDAGGVDTQVDA